MHGQRFWSDSFAQSLGMASHALSFQTPFCESYAMAQYWFSAHVAELHVAASGFEGWLVPPPPFPLAGQSESKSLAFAMSSHDFFSKHDMRSSVIVALQMRFEQSDFD